MRSHSVLSIDSCLIHDRRIESALPAFAQAANELELKDLQNLLLTVEPTGHGLLWRLRFHGREPKWPRDEVAHRVAALLPEAVVLDDAVALEVRHMAFRRQRDPVVQNTSQATLHRH